MDGGTIKNDNNIGKVEAKAINLAHSGGIAGQIINGTLENDNNTGDVSAESTSYYAYSGGIAGNMSYSEIYNSNNTGEVKATSEDSDVSGGDKAYSGGIAGQMSGGGTIENDNNMGRIYAESTSSALSASSTAYSGGIVGQVDLQATSAAINNNSNIGAVRTESVNAFSGGIAGEVQVSAWGGDAEAEINNNSNTGKVEADASNGNAFSGGIAGNVGLSDGFSIPPAPAPTANATINNCSNTGSDNISAISNSTDNTKYSRSGGIVGSMEGGGTIKNSRNTDNVTATAPSTSSYAGGIVGYTTVSTIDNDSNAGKVEASGSFKVSSGGVAGYTDNSDIKNSRNTDNVTAISSSTSSYAFLYSGGIVGYLYDGSSVTTSYNRGRVYAESTYIDAYSGGIAGYIYFGSSSVETSYNTGDVEATAKGTSSGDAYSGGIGGKDNGGGIDNSYNTGSVTATASGSDNKSYSGGIAGQYSGLMERCYNTGNVEAAANGTSGTAYSGGIVGELSAASSVIQCAAVDGEISSIGAGGTTLNIGKIVGFMPPSGSLAQNNFALDLMDLSPSATADSDDGYPKSKNDFEEVTTYRDSTPGGLGWNFTSTWYWDVDHPILLWENQ
jgi:hypothetical protein